MKPVTFLERVLDPPSYGFLNKDGELHVPSHRVIWGEFFRRLNIFRSRKHWLALFSWFMVVVYAVPLFIFITHYFSVPLLIAAFFYSMVILGSHGTFWFHRHGTHRAFQFRNRFLMQVCRNLVPRTIPEETYVVSHHVHHQFPEKPGDPYNVHGGWLYCFLSDVNHQSIRQDMDEKDYSQLAKLLRHTGVRVNSYANYLKWGTLAHPIWTVLHYAVSFAAWYAIFYWIGGHALATALIGSVGVWFVGVRTFNYEGHGKGKDRRRDGIDFNRKDWSVNQMWPGLVAGEWHNNHHLFPNGAKSGFLPYQVDLPWLFIRGLHRIGVVSGYRDYQAEFDALPEVRAHKGKGRGERPAVAAGV